MRIWGVLIPLGYLRWSAAGTGVVVLGALIAALVNMVGLLDTPTADQGRKARASVVTGVPCDRAGSMETITFQAGGKEHRARFDGCGHTEGEPVEVTIPTGPLPENAVVHAANAAVGDATRTKDLAPLLIVASGIAGATYTHLLRRTPRTTPPTLK